jgi:hypothetical protein
MRPKMNIENETIDHGVDAESAEASGAVAVNWLGASSRKGMVRILK